MFAKRGAKLKVEPAELSPLRVQRREAMDEIMRVASKLTQEEGRDETPGRQPFHFSHAMDFDRFVFERVLNEGEHHLKSNYILDNDVQTLSLAASPY